MRPVALTLSCLLLLAGCAEEDGEGPLAFSIVPTCVRVPVASEQVFRTAEEWRAFHERHGAEGMAPPVDFERLMVVARFDGVGSACVSFTVEGVEARKGRITVSATRHVSPNPCIAVVAYPQVALSVERSDFPLVFRIREVRDDVAPARPCF